LTTSGEHLSLEDFFTGLFAGLALRGVCYFAQDCEMALVRAVSHLPPELEQRFRIRPHPIHGESSTAYRGLYGAIQRGLGAVEGPFIRIKLSKEEAGDLLETVPGGKAVFLRVASAFARSV
jgi:hypothetical protein